MFVYALLFVITPGGPFSPPPPSLNYSSGDRPIKTTRSWIVVNTHGHCYSPYLTNGPLNSFPYRSLSRLTGSAKISFPSARNPSIVRPFFGRPSDRSQKGPWIWDERKAKQTRISFKKRSVLHQIMIGSKKRSLTLE